ncbi:MAG: REP-associated tyrosine transposase [Candidatus Cloacimonadota bacterium]|nr:REP-associated tyrosine transposase [Candidatus Cloacimonadota bacterium]
MQHTFFKLWIHLVWSTKGREPFLLNRNRKDIFFHIKETGEEKGFHLDVINGTKNHVHCLLSLNPKWSISEIANQLKGESSHWINEQNLMKPKFFWQRGFGAFSVSQSNVQRIRNYILNQEEHHRKISFKEEWQILLKKHNIVIDKRT